LQSSAQQVFDFAYRETQNRGAGRKRYSKENSQYKTVARDRGKKKQPSKLEREMGRRLLRWTWKISTALDRGLYRLHKDNVIDNVAELQGGDSIQYRILRDVDTASEQKGCVESFVERFIYHPGSSFPLPRHPRRAAVYEGVPSARIGGSPTACGFPGKHVKPLFPSRSTTMPCESLSMILADFAMSVGRHRPGYLRLRCLAGIRRGTVISRLGISGGSRIRSVHQRHARTKRQ
jgi:hypothetical protein